MGPKICIRSPNIHINEPCGMLGGRGIFKNRIPLKIFKAIGIDFFYVN